MTQLRERDIAEQINLIASLTAETVAEQSQHATENFLQYGPVILADSIRALDRDTPALIDQLTKAAATATLEESRIVLLKTCRFLAGAQYGLAEDLREKYQPVFLETIVNAGLNDPSPDVRKTVVAILRSSFLGADMDKKITEPLAMMLADTDPEVRNAAAMPLAGRMEWHMTGTRENLWEQKLRGVFAQRAQAQHMDPEVTAGIDSEITQHMAGIQAGLPAPNLQ